MMLTELLINSNMSGHEQNLEMSECFIFVSSPVFFYFKEISEHIWKKKTIEDKRF